MLERIIDSGTHIENGESREYSLILCCPAPPFPTIVVVECNSRTDAENQARKLSLGREPVYHNAHKGGDKNHYHIHGHLLIKFADTPGRLYNYHFVFGDRIGLSANERIQQLLSF